MVNDSVRRCYQGEFKRQYQLIFAIMTLLLIYISTIVGRVHLTNTEQYTLADLVAAHKFHEWNMGKTLYAIP